VQYSAVQCSAVQGVPGGGGVGRRGGGGGQGVPARQLPEVQPVDGLGEGDSIQLGSVRAVYFGPVRPAWNKLKAARQETSSNEDTRK
jgi:hypothetical protein